MTITNGIFSFKEKWFNAFRTSLVSCEDFHNLDKLVSVDLVKWMDHSREGVIGIKTHAVEEDRKHAIKDEDLDWWLML